MKDKIAFTVRDEGPGIEENKAGEIFDKYRRQTTMKDQELSPEGLGLAIVYKYTSALQGEVRLQTNPGKGTAFTVELPTNMQV
jgi:K+-sensing histidine kinase KdpD